MTAQAAETAGAIKNGLSYLKTMQNNDGGFTEREGLPSSDRLTHWVIMALRAAGEDVSSKAWQKNGYSPIDFILKNTQLDETTHYARALMALKAVGAKSIVNGVNLEDKIISFQKANGQFAQYDKGEQDLVNAHVWSILALSAAQREIPKKDKARDWLARQQNIDGGFPWAVGGISDPDSTGVALTALILLGETPDSTKIKRAIKYLDTQQQAQGGFNSDIDKANSASTAWAIQGLLAVGENPKDAKWQKSGGNPFTYLLSLQNKNGSFDWTEGRQASSVLMTAYSIMALAEKPFPVNINYPLTGKKIILTIDQQEAWIGQNKTTLEVPPKIIEGRTMVPLRFIVESLGAKIEWEGKAQRIDISLGDKKMTLFIGVKNPGLDIPPLIEEGRTLVPLRYISESLGAKVNWDGQIRKIEIEI